MRTLAKDLVKSYKILLCIQRSPQLHFKPFDADTLNQMALNLEEIVSGTSSDRDSSHVATIGSEDNLGAFQPD